MPTTPQGVLAVANVLYRSIDLFDHTTGASLGTVADLIAQPHEVAADPEHRRLFVSHTYRNGGYGSGAEQGHEISVVDADTRTVIDVLDIHPFAAPHGLRYRPATGLLYASVEGSEAGNGVVLIDPARRSVVGSVATTARNAHWVAVTASGDRGYASHKEAPFVSVLDLHAGEAVGTVELPGGAEELDLSADDRYLYVVTPHQTPPAPDDHLPTRLVKIDTGTLEIVGEVPLERPCSAVHAGPGGTVYVTQMTPISKPFGSEQGKLHVIDGATLTRRGTIPLGRESFTVREAPDGATAAVANGASDTVSIVDVAALSVARTMAITPQGDDVPFSGAHGMAFLG